MERRIFGADCTAQVNDAKLLELLQKPSGHWSPASSSMLVFGIPLRIEDSLRKRAGYWPHQLSVYCDVTLRQTHPSCQWRRTPATINKFVVRYEMKITVRTQAIMSASFSFIPSLGPSAVAQSRNHFFLFFTNPVF